MQVLPRAHKTSPARYSSNEITHDHLLWSYLETMREPTLAAHELAVGIVAYLVLADGLLTGAVGPEPNGGEGHLMPPRLLPSHRAASVAIV